MPFRTALMPCFSKMAYQRQVPSRRSAQWHTGLPTQWHTGLTAQWHTGLTAQWHTGRRIPAAASHTTIGTHGTHAPHTQHCMSQWGTRGRHLSWSGKGTWPAARPSHSRPWSTSLSAPHAPCQSTQGAARERVNRLLGCRSLGAYGPEHVACPDPDGDGAGDRAAGSRWAAGQQSSSARLLACRCVRGRIARPRALGLPPASHMPRTHVYTVDTSAHEHAHIHVRA